MKLTTTVFDAKKKGKAKASNTRMAYTINSEAALSLKGAEMTAFVLKNKRDWHRRQQQQTEEGDVGGDDGYDPGCCGDSRAGKGSSMTATCPIISALRIGEGAAREGRAGVAKSPPADPPADQEVDTCMLILLYRTTREASHNHSYTSYMCDCCSTSTTY